MSIVLLVYNKVMLQLSDNIGLAQSDYLHYTGR